MEVVACLVDNEETAADSVVVSGMMVVDMDVLLLNNAIVGKLNLAVLLFIEKEHS